MDYPSAIPDAIEDICARAASNMIQYLVMNRTGPLIRISDYKVTIPEQAVLTDELKGLLVPWITARTIYAKQTTHETEELKEYWDED